MSIVKVNIDVTPSRYDWTKVTESPALLGEFARAFFRESLAKPVGRVEEVKIGGRALVVVLGVP